jgi:hypothetical protein
LAKPAPTLPSVFVGLPVQIRPLGEIVIFAKLVEREEQDPEEGYLDQELFEPLSRKDMMDAEGPDIW